MRNSLYLILFLLVLIGVFILHLQFDSGIKIFLIQSYFINAIMAILALLLLSIGMQHKKNNLANLYLLTVAIKLVVYFLFFHPKFKLDGNILRKEFFIFFIPYSIGLLAEIVMLGRRFR